MTIEATDVRHTPRTKLILLAAVAVVTAVGYLQFGDALSLEIVAQQETTLRTFQEARPGLVYGVAFLVYVTVTGLSLPGAAALTVGFGWYFGFLPGVVLVSLASTTGASLAFLLSRYALRGAIQSKFGDCLRIFNDALVHDGAFYLFTLRLVPAVPFFVINLVMGLTPLRLSTFWWASQVGMLPGTAVYVYAGATVPDLQTLNETGTAGIVTPQLIAAFVLLGVFPVLVKSAVQRLRRS